MTNTMLRKWWPDAIDHLTGIGHDPDEAHGALLILYLLETTGMRLVVRSDFTVEILAPGHLLPLLWDGSEADRCIRAWWPTLANAVRARDSLRDDDGEHLRDQMMTLEEMARKYGDWRPDPEDVRAWYRRKARERGELAP